MMERNCSHLNEEISEFKALLGAIGVLSVEAFQKAYGSSEADQARDIGYAFIGESQIRA